MSFEFKISDDILIQYQALQFQSNASSSCNYLPLATLIWKDEHPNGKLPRKMDEESRTSIYKLIEARRVFWDRNEVPPELEILWLQAKSIIPNWPGFQRLHLTEDQMNEVIACEKNSEELFRALMESSDQFELKKEKDGTSTFSASFDITPETEEVKKPWWKFWKRS